MTEQQIQLLIEMDIEVWDAYLPYLSAEMKQQIILGAYSGLTAAEIVANIGSATLTGNQVATLVTTTLNNYSRSINLLMMDESPANTLYQYVGPIDEKTRDICLQMGSTGELTQKQIINNFGSDVLIYAGGYNCRHKWQSVSEVGVSKRIYDPQLAKELLKSGS